MLLGGDWKCPNCGTSNRTFSHSTAVCRDCGYLARSFTAWIRLLLNRYYGVELRIDYDLGRKGRRKLRPTPIVGTFEGVVHEPTSGFMLCVLTKRLGGRRVKLHLKLPLGKVLPWGPALDQTIRNIEQVLQTKRLPETFSQLASPEVQLVD